MRRGAVRALVALGLVAGSLTFFSAGTATPAAVAATGGGWSQTKKLTRDYYVNSRTVEDPADPSAPPTVVGDQASDSRTVTVRVDKHTDLQSRERIHVTWSGAHPSGGRAANPFGEKGLSQEYPVLLLECRGVDDPSLPAARQIRPSTCWTSTAAQRTLSQSASVASWVHDAAASDADRAHVSGIDPDKVPADCPVADSETYHITPFEGADGKFYAGCNANNMPPQAAAGTADPPNETAAFTALDGTGSADFEVRTSTENEALGCSHTVACTLVVIPIMGISCDAPGGFCNETGNYLPGSTNDGSVGPAEAVSPALWWSPSNWDNRFSVPLDFAQPPNTCSLLGQGDPVPFYGSELMSQAALQWAPAYCLNRSRFNWQANSMPDEAAFTLMKTGGAAAAQISGRQDGDRGIGYAPTAVTGWGIGFVVDKPGNAGEQQSLRLNARLIAKLLTESYPGSPTGAKRPGLGDNPLSINLDPEFEALNPGLDTDHFSEAASTLLALNTSAQLVVQLTSYLQTDPDARAFLNGKADPWGMTVNPAYKKIQLPVDTWPLLDTWFPQKTGNGCLDANPGPYLPKIAAPVSNLRLISIALLLGWPNVNTLCDYDPSANIYKIGRIAQQGIGQRFMLGIVSLSDAQRYGIRVASLQAAKGAYVAGDNAGMRSAVGLMDRVGTSRTSKREDLSLRPYDLDQAKVRRSRTAYPGTMAVYTAAKTYGLDKTTARHVGQFISVSLTEGQKPGRGNGQLPAGYLPIVDSGPTKKLYDAALAVRRAVLAQKPPAAATPTSPSTTPTSTGGTTTGPSTAAPGNAPTSAAPPGAAPASRQPGSGSVATAAAKTAPVSSSLGSGLLPLLLLGGLAAGLVASVSRLLLRVRGVR
ncbi:hypothetical protein [Nocardioides sp. CER19]|uniref:hypothetical protein n=1 Tax=Nocardioides sp. CER19 TaxID=3038538 RepID=UPI0024481DE5|nr:hypothetical protein [Nocardioides sp. CER19]MDH2414842.1 hypothetical protein [Nocardioides sp. CER19]